LFFQAGFVVLDRAELGAEFDEPLIVAGLRGQGGSQACFPVADPGELAFQPL
jgi:hypothetical protein